MARTTQTRSGTTNFRERLGERDIELDDYKVDDLRKIASELNITGSHDLHKNDLVNRINKARRDTEK